MSTSHPESYVAKPMERAGDDAVAAARIRSCRSRLPAGIAGLAACIVVAVLAVRSSISPNYILAWATLAAAVTLGGGALFLRSIADARLPRMKATTQIFAIATAAVWAGAAAAPVTGNTMATSVIALGLMLGVGAAWFWTFATLPRVMGIVGITLAVAAAGRLVFIGDPTVYPLTAVAIFALAALFQFARAYGGSLAESWRDSHDSAWREAKIVRESERALAEERRRRTALFDQIAEGRFRAQIGGPISYANAAMARIFGYESAPALTEAAGSDWRTLFAQPDIARNLETILISNRAVEFVELEIHRPDGQTRRLSVSAHDLQGQDDATTFEGRVQDVTAQRQAEDALSQEVKWLARAEAVAQLGHWRWDLDTGAIAWSPQVYQVYGHDPDTYRPDVESILAMVHAEDRDLVVESFDRAITRQTAFEFEARVLRPSGEERIVLVRGDCETDATGRACALLGVTQDVTADRHAKQALRRSEAFYRAIVEAQGELICRCLFDGVITFANQAFCKFFGLTREQAFGASLFGSTDENAVLRPAVAATISDTLDRLTVSAPQQSVELTVTGADGTERWLSITFQALFDQRQHLLEYQMVARDITERKAADSQIAHLAHHDPLTDLPNRVLFRDHLELATAQAKRSASKVAILMLDLDRFKSINDSLGHAAGDQVLVEAARRLSDCVRAVDTVARLGGDEFAVVQAGIDDGEQAAVLAQRINKALATPYTIDGHEVPCGTSIGIAIYPDDGQDLDQLLKNADMALYRAKERQRGTFEFYSSDLGRRSKDRMEIAHGLAQAVERDELSLVYQPKFDLLDRKILGIEALVRWNHPTRGPIEADKFLPVAEATGQTVQIGDWVLRTACEQIRRWRDTGLYKLPVSISLSAAQFRDRELLNKVRDAVAAAGIGPDHLEVEIAESALMRDATTAAGLLKELAETGLQVTIDGFGTGYSSLNYLEQFPVQKLRMDKSLIASLGARDQDAAIARAVTHLGHSLGLRIVANSVENDSQLKALASLGCDEVQGRLFCPPLAPDALAQFVAEQRGAASKTDKHPSGLALADH